MSDVLFIFSEDLSESFNSNLQFTAKTDQKPILGQSGKPQQDVAQMMIPSFIQEQEPHSLHLSQAQGTGTYFCPDSLLHFAKFHLPPSYKW